MVKLTKKTKQLMGVKGTSRGIANANRNFSYRFSKLDDARFNVNAQFRNMFLDIMTKIELDIKEGYPLKILTWW